MILSLNKPETKTNLLSIKLSRILELKYFKVLKHYSISHLVTLSPHRSYPRSLTREKITQQIYKIKKLTLVRPYSLQWRCEISYVSDLSQSASSQSSPRSRGTDSSRSLLRPSWCSSGWADPGSSCSSSGIWPGRSCWWAGDHEWPPAWVEHWSGSQSGLPGIGVGNQWSQLDAETRSLSCLRPKIRILWKYLSNNVRLIKLWKRKTIFRL